MNTAEFDSEFTKRMYNAEWEVSSAAIKVHSVKGTIFELKCTIPVNPRQSVSRTLYADRVPVTYLDAESLSVEAAVWEDGTTASTGALLSACTFLSKRDVMLKREQEARERQEQEDREKSELTAKRNAAAAELFARVRAAENAEMRARLGTSKL